ncbi:MAG: hypothetical protein PHQ22_02540 [Sulfuricurvum sp.]|nr:hypothetical protein [Sulfuricurvum sp.]MDD5386053.1 hypothetical protein [Sulfuricurvum sp.]
MYATKRSGFAMILAIFVVLLVALGGVLLLSNATTGAKSIGDNYLYAQAELLADSATEFAVMRAQGFDHTGGTCLNQLNITVNGSDGATHMFDANVSLAYSFRGAAIAGCTTLNSTTNKDTMILMDVTVEDHNLSTEPIRVHKRSWQKL